MDDIKQKILGLMAKTISNGCTEEEAMAASKKVQEMLNKYQLSLSDIKLKESKCITGEYDTKLRAQSPVQWCIAAVGYFTDTIPWSSYHGDIIFYKFFGLEHDVLIAEYVTKICDWAIIYEGEDFKGHEAYSLTPKGARSKVLRDFRTAMAYRIAKRLREMKNAQNSMNASTGRDLVVVKGAIISEEFAKLNMRLKTGKSKYEFTNAAAYAAGTAAGDRLSINPGVN